MGGCAASKLGVGDEDEAVAICRERKRLIKSAVERRCALADAHSRYVHSLYTVACAVSLFVARHSSPAHLLLTSSAVSEPAFLRRTPTEPKTETAVFRWSRSPSSSSSSSAEQTPAAASKPDIPSVNYGSFFETTPPAPSPARGFGWDFFDPFEPAEAAALHRGSEEDLRVVREEEGIPELEEEGECLAERIKRGKKLVPVENNAVSAKGDGEKDLAVVEEAEKGRELLDALKDIFDLFIKAYDSGRDVSRMLEANTLDPQAGVEEKKENTSKLVQAIAWHRSPSSQSPSSASFKSLLGSSSRDVSSVDGRTSSSLFDDYGGMASGSHSLTLQRLYAWEKKLYEEVKAGDRIRRLYERRCSQLSSHNAKGVESRSTDKAKTAAKDLYTRIVVTLRTVETMSERIQKLRDEELEPQLVELIKGLTDTWRTMVDSHESQAQIMLQVKSFTSPSHVKFSTHLHRNAAIQLLGEVQNWRACFQCYVTAQREYVEAVQGWLAKFLAPGPGSEPPRLIVLSRDWLASVRTLAESPVTTAMKSLSRELRSLCNRQEEEQLQKRRVDAQAKELDRTEVALQRAENRILEPESDVWNRVEGLAEKKDRIEAARYRLEVEKLKHRECMQATQRAALEGLKSGLVNVFDSLADFSRDSLKLYSTLSAVNVKEEINECR